MTKKHKLPEHLVEQATSSKKRKESPANKLSEKSLSPVEKEAMDVLMGFSLSVTEENDLSEKLPVNYLAPRFRHSSLTPANPVNKERTALDNANADLTPISSSQPNLTEPTSSFTSSSPLLSSSMDLDSEEFSDFSSSSASSPPSASPSPVPPLSMNFGSTFNTQVNEPSASYSRTVPFSLDLSSIGIHRPQASSESSSSAPFAASSPPQPAPQPPLQTGIPLNKLMLGSFAPLIASISTFSSAYSLTPHTQLQESISNITKKYAGLIQQHLEPALTNFSNVATTFGAKPIHYSTVDQILNRFQAAYQKKLVGQARQDMEQLFKEMKTDARYFYETTKRNLGSRNVDMSLQDSIILTARLYKKVMEKPLPTSELSQHLPLFIYLQAIGFYIKHKLPLAETTHIFMGTLIQAMPSLIAETQLPTSLPSPLSSPRQEGVSSRGSSSSMMIEPARLSSRNENPDELTLTSSAPGLTPELSSTLDLDLIDLDLSVPSAPQLPESLSNSPNRQVDNQSSSMDKESVAPSPKRTIDTPVMKPQTTVDLSDPAVKKRIDGFLIFCLELAASENQAAELKKCIKPAALSYEQQQIHSHTTSPFTARDTYNLNQFFQRFITAYQQNLVGEQDHQDSVLLFNKITALCKGFVDLQAKRYSLHQDSPMDRYDSRFFAAQIYIKAVQDSMLPNNLLAKKLPLYVYTQFMALYLKHQLPLTEYTVMFMREVIQTLSMHVSPSALSTPTQVLTSSSSSAPSPSHAGVSSRESSPSVAMMATPTALPLPPLPARSSSSSAVPTQPQLPTFFSPTPAVKKSSEGSPVSHPAPTLPTQLSPMFFNKSAPLARKTPAEIEATRKELPDGLLPSLPQ